MDGVLLHQCREGSWYDRAAQGAPNRGPPETCVPNVNVGPNHSRRVLDCGGDQPRALT
jgi:hypothetical protein